MNENKEELENIYNDLNQKYLDIVNKYYSPKKQEILKKLEIIKKKGFKKFEEDIKKILENDENKKNNNMKEKINDIEKVKKLKNKFEILIGVEEEINDDDNLKNYIKKYEFDEIKTIINDLIEKEISRLHEKKENEKEKEENQKLIDRFIQQKDIYSKILFDEKE